MAQGDNPIDIDLPRSAFVLETMNRGEAPLAWLTTSKGEQPAVVLLAALSGSAVVS